MALSRKIVFLAVAVFLAHIVVLWAFGLSPVGVVLSNIVQTAASLTAAVACISAARGANPFYRRYWLLVSLCFLFWSGSQLIWSLEDKLNQGAIAILAPTDALFFLSFAPFVMALLLDQEEPGSGVDWQRVLDIAQVFVVASAAYAYFFYIPKHWETPDEGINRVLGEVFNLRNLFLTVAFALRVAVTRSQALRSLFSRTALFLLVYSVVTGLVNDARLKAKVVTGMWFDLGWSLPFLVAAVLVATWKPKPLDLETDRTPGVRSVLAINLLPSLLPLLVLIMATTMVQRQFGLAVGSVLVSFLCYSVRLGVTQARQLRAAQESREAEARFRMLFASNPHPMWVFDVESLNFLEVNEAALRNYGYSRDEFLQLKVTDIRPSEDVQKFLRTVHATEHAMESFGEWRHQKKDGTVVDVLISAQPLELGGRKAEIVIAEDVTHRRRMEATLLQAQKMEAVGTLAGGVAHDFNNLLTVISGYTKLLIDNVPGGERESHQLQQIDKAAERAASLTRQLLAFSRKQVLQPKPLDLNEMTTGMEKMLRRVISENIEFVMNLAPELGLIHADPGQIEQVILNLVLNASEAMVAGGRLTIETRNMDAARSEFPSPPAEGFVLLTVHDTGCGMDVELQTRIFEPFFTTKKSMGTGLGLSSVLGIVQQSGGQVRVRSASGRGSTFELYFPRVEKTSTSRPVSPTRAQGSETILLVEDDESLRELSSKILGMNGYSVLAASRAIEAEKICREFQGEIHLMVTDVIMPGMAGPDLARLLSVTRPAMKVLYMSGYTDNMMVEHGVVEPGFAFIQKPFTPAALAMKIREVLDRSTTVVQP